jgi:hypothetical protein
MVNDGQRASDDDDVEKVDRTSSHLAPTKAYGPCDTAHSRRLDWQPLQNAQMRVAGSPQIPAYDAAADDHNFAADARVHSNHSSCDHRKTPALLRSTCRQVITKNVRS